MSLPKQTERRMKMKKAAGAIAVLIEIMRGEGELYLSPDARRGIYDLLCEADTEVSCAARKES